MATTKVQSELIVDDVALAGNPTTSTQSAGNNTTRIATTAFVTTAVNNLIDSAPGTMDTLNEIAAALGDDPSFTTTVNNAIATKLPLSGGTMTGDLTIPDKIIHAGDTDTYLQFNAANTFRIVAGDDERFRVATSEVVVNETGLDVDFRVESDGNTNMLTVDAGNNRVGIATASPSTPLHVIYVGNPNGGNRNTVEDVLTLEATGYYPYTGYGVGINFQGEDYGNTAIRDYGKIQAVMEGNADQNASGDPSFTSQLGFWTNSGGASNTVSTQKMTIKSDGKVGIGDTSPFSKLHVEDTGWSSGAPYGTVAYIEGGAVNDLNWGHLVVSQSGTTTDTGGRISFGANGQNPIAGIRTKYKGATYGDLAFLTRPSGGTNTERMVIDSTGRVGINRTPAISNSKLEVGGADNVPLINVEASGATAGVGIGSSRMKFYYGTTEKASIDSNGNLRTARQILQENSDGTPRFINIPYSSAASGFTFNWDDLANHSAVGDQTSESNAFMFEVNVTSYLFRRVKALIIVDTNATNSIAVHTIHNSTLTCSASIPTGSEQITITIGGLWSNAVNYMGRITTF